MTKEDFLVLLNRYILGETNLEENEKLLNYYESFQASKEWDDSLGPKERIQNKMLNRIQAALKPEETKVVSLKPFYSRTSFKVAAAASIAMLISITLLYNTVEKPVNLTT